MGTWNVESRARRAASAATADVAPWIATLARVGYVAKAVLYATVGVLAARAALGTGGRTTDTRGALGSVLRAPFGRALLLLMALGLVGYAAWRVVQAVADPERRGTSVKGLALRVSYVLRGLLHAGLALTAIRLASGEGRRGGGDSSERWTARALEAPAGEWLVWLIGAGVVGYGLYQLYRAYAAKLSKQLDLGRLSADTGRWAVGVSRFGIGARGVVFALVGVLLVRAATRHDARQAGGLADSLATLGDVGRWPLAIVALGLVAYGVYELVNAKYRRIQTVGEDVPQPGDEVPADQRAADAEEGAVHRHQVFATPPDSPGQCEPGPSDDRPRDPRLSYCPELSPRATSSSSS